VDPELSAVVRRHLRFVLPEEPIEPDTPLQELGLDSMSAINLLVDLEQNLGLIFPDELLNQDTFRTMHTLAAAVAKLRGAAEE
jgi:acyl carrier protein